MTSKEIISILKKNGSEYNRQGMKRYGINVDKAFGISVTNLRKLAKQIGKNHDLAIELWETGYHEARHLASMIAVPKLVTKSLMNKWVKDFNSWDICDGTCSNLFCKTPYAVDKIFEWSKSNKEFVRRTAFSLIAYLAVHDKKRNDEDFLLFFELIKKYSTDERNFVKKAVNWSLRQIGKRSRSLNEKAIQLAEDIKQIDSRSAKWIANDAIKELKNPKTLARIKN
ncbi:MAG: DNA alkylation repair protein [Melioribacteraceae bacterium]|nr:DNA alkylation repair protein [Melioribacteraceae bacterium]